MYKGAGGDSLYGNNSNALSHSTLVSDLNTDREINTAPQVSPVSYHVFDELFISTIIKPI